MNVAGPLLKTSRVVAEPRLAMSAVIYPATWVGHLDHGVSPSPPPRHEPMHPLAGRLIDRFRIEQALRIA